MKRDTTSKVIGWILMIIGFFFIIMGLIIFSSLNYQSPFSAIYGPLIFWILGIIFIFVGNYIRTKK